LKNTIRDIERRETDTGRNQEHGGVVYGSDGREGETHAAAELKKNSKSGNR